jgi:hypothetical protein
MEIGKDLRLGVMSILIQYEDLFLKSQEYTAKYANEYIDLQIKTYGFFVELFKARAQVYETILRGEIAKVETFKAQIEAQVAISQVNEQRVKVYSEKIRAVLAQVDVYKAQIEAMNAFILGTKNKIEANKLTMDAWAVKANALIQEYTGKVSAFRASTEFATAMAALHSKTEEANLRMGLAAAELNVRSLESYDRVGVAGANVRMEAARGVASAAATLAAGALAAANAHASISHETKEEEE